MLTQDREEELCQRLQTNGDLEAARELVMSHLRFVVKVARDWVG
jgi:RNA polymerase sigma-32 factor